MGITLFHAGLAAGAALAAVPVILHLFMRQTPKHVVFPALRLIRDRQKQSRKKLRIKNWLLLLARAALIALMALALARPSLVTQATLGADDVPSALGLVFDTSLSMGFKERDKTRLDEAKERALDILKKAPDTSQVFVVDSAEPATPLALSPAAARKRIADLTIRPANRPLNAAVGLAYEGVAGSDRPRREVYVLTDLASSSWNHSESVEGLDKIKTIKPGVSTFVLRLTPKEVQDVAVVEAEPTSGVATQGEPVEVRAKVRSAGPPTRRVAELYVDGVKKDQKAVDLPADGEVEVRFPLPRLDPSTPLHQGEVRITGAPDPVAFDDIRYFSFTVQPPRRILVVSDRAIDSVFVAYALDPDPETLAPGTPRTCRVERATPAELAAMSADALKGYTGVFLLNVRSLPDVTWQSLNAYVREGGGLVIGLGNLALAENYNAGAAAGLVPAALDRPVPANPQTTFGKMADATHPLFRDYPKELDALLSAVPVFRYWSVKPSGAKGTRTLLSYAGGGPALIERTFPGPKTGRVLLWTTPLARDPDTSARASWNEFPLADWPFFHIMNQTVPYLAGATAERLNYEAGEPGVILPNDPTRRFTNFSVLGPDTKTPFRLSPPGATEPLVIPSPQAIGQWKVTATEADGKAAALGFSVNAPLSETQYTALQTAQLDALFGGKDGYKLADNPESLESIVRISQVGREIFPWIMALILALVTAEGLLANRFHREGARPAAGVPSSAG